jgi:hypothetical protein
MAKMTRQTMLWFGSNVGGAEIGVFGSLAAGSPAYSTVIATIQSLPAWGSGWSAETIATNRPALEDMNAVCYVLSYGVSYLHQMGIAEYDAGTVYYTNSLCMYNGVIYQSLEDSNVGNTPANGTYWYANVVMLNSSHQIKAVDGSLLTGITGRLTAGSPCVQNPVTVATKTTQAHGLGAIPNLVVAYYECLSADNNYAQGDRIMMQNEQSYYGGSMWRMDATNVYILTHATNAPQALDGVTPESAVTLTASKWKAVVIPYKLT